jgi:hypothetical protein
MPVTRHGRQQRKSGGVATSPKPGASPPISLSCRTCGKGRSISGPPAGHTSDFQLCGSIRDIVAAIVFGNIVCRSTARGDETSAYGHQTDISPLERL